MNDRQNRTIICSILFLDIVEYSRKPVAEQIALRDRFNQLLSQALHGVAANDRVILDTGDGAAITFLGDPEDALFMALTLRDTLAADALSAQPAFQLRLGINLGPVKLVKDLNGRPNIIGDGINVAQRIMSFAQRGQVLVSRSYYEVVSRLSEEYSGLFHYEGSRTDKHVREHEVYSVGAHSAALKRTLAAYPHELSRVQRGSKSMIRRLANTATTINTEARRRPRFITAVAVVAILASATAMRGYREQSVAPMVAAANPAIPTIVMPDAAPGAHVLVQSVPATHTPVVLQAPKAADSDSTAVVETPKLVLKSDTARKPAAPTGPVVLLAIAPWGEIYVDGEKRGISPPLRTVKLTPGQHKIEIRNAGFPSRVENVEVQPGSRITIKHKFH